MLTHDSLHRRRRRHHHHPPPHLAFPPHVLQINNCARDLLTEMGYGRHAARPEEVRENKKLRPAEDVLHRIKWDPDHRPEDYVIGYEDRCALQTMT